MPSNRIPTTANKHLAKKRVQCLIEHSTSFQLLYWFERFVLRGTLLRQMRTVMFNAPGDNSKGNFMVDNKLILSKISEISLTKFLADVEQSL
jgi:hypothetical protein